MLRINTNHLLCLLLKGLMTIPVLEYIDTLKGHPRLRCDGYEFIRHRAYNNSVHWRYVNIK
jgi:hypothetical protein